MFSLKKGVVVALRSRKYYSFSPMLEEAVPKKPAA
jgi:hypothetical protein